MHFTCNTVGNNQKYGMEWNNTETHQAIVLPVLTLGNSGNSLFTGLYCCVTDSYFTKSPFRGRVFFFFAVSSFPCNKRGGK